MLGAKKSLEAPKSKLRRIKELKIRFTPTCTTVNMYFFLNKV
jgi:hypothetical protein